MSVALLRALKELAGNELDYLPYNIADTTISVGAPPLVVDGFDYVFATHLNRQRRHVSSLAGAGVFVSNLNSAGIVEIGLMQGSASVGALEAINLTGVAVPIFIVDKSSGGTSFAFASACKLIKTPEWRREAFPTLTIFTYHASRLKTSLGVRNIGS